MQEIRENFGKKHSGARVSVFDGRRGTSRSDPLIHRDPGEKSIEQHIVSEYI